MAAVPRAPLRLSRLTNIDTNWIQLFQAVGRRQPREMAAAAEPLLVIEPGESQRRPYLIAATLLGHLVAGNRGAARAVWRREQPLRVTGSWRFVLDVLAAHTVEY